MGRIQKKKDPQKKRKKKKKAAAAGASPGAAASDGRKDSNKSSRPAAGAGAKTGRKQGMASGAVARKAGDLLEKGYIGKAVQFLREVKVELKKVTWPSRRQTIGSTAVVLVLVIIVSLFLGITDFILGKLVQMVLG